MDADQIIQTARTNLDRLLARSREQAAELTQAGRGSEYADVREALEEGVRSLETLRDRLNDGSPFAASSPRPEQEPSP